MKKIFEHQNNLKIPLDKFGIYVIIQKLSDRDKHSNEYLGV